MTFLPVSVSFETQLIAKMSRIIGVLAMLYVVGSTLAWFETCDHSTTLNLGQSIQIHSPNYPNSFPAGSSCRYNVTAPSLTQIQVQCQIQMDKTPSGSCKDKFYISTDGNFGAAEFFCGAGSVTRTSKYSQLSIAYTSFAPVSPSSGFNCILSVQTAPCDCGWSVNARIVGGTNADVNEFTPMVGLVLLQTAVIFCGGTIISPTMVLTAASCLGLYIPLLIRVLVGESDTSTGTDTPYTKLYSAKRFIRHPMYSPINSRNDIGLIETTTQILYTRGVGPACLPFSLAGQSFENVNVEAAGWGTKAFGIDRSTTLQKVSLTVISNSVCQQSHPQLAQSQMCTYSPGKDTCQFDTGGPLFTRGARLFIVGIVSFGVACATSTPTVNTRVTYYLPWIRQTVDSVSSGTLCVK